MKIIRISVSRTALMPMALMLLLTQTLPGLPANAQSASGGVSEFRLPPGPTQTPTAEGPVAEGLPPPRIAPAPLEPSDSPVNAPRATPTATRTPTPTPTTSARPSPRPSPTPSPRPSPRPSSAKPAQAAPTPARSSSPATPAPAAISAERAQGGADSPAAPPAAIATSPTDKTQSEQAQTNQPPEAIVQVETAPEAKAQGARSGTDAGPGMPGWMPWLITLLGFGLIWLIGWFWWARRTDSAPVTVPRLERPKPKPAPQSTGAAAPPAISAATGAAPAIGAGKNANEPASEPASDRADENATLRVALEPRQLAITLVQASLSYRLILSNRGDNALDDIVVEGDMISAHSSMSQEDQTAQSSSKLALLHTVARFRSGENQVLEGQLRLPLPQVRPIRRDGMALFVPLVRLRIASGAGTITLQTSLIGQRSPQIGERLQPFRLDLGPRIYTELLQRSFA